MTIFRTEPRPLTIQTRVARHTVVLFATLGTLCNGGADDAPVRFSEPTELPEAGLRIYTMPDAEAVPLSPPERQLMVAKIGNESVTSEIYRPVDFWRRDEQVAAWRDAAGNRLTVAAITYLPDTGLKPTQCTREAVEAALARNQHSPPRWTQENITIWMQTFTGHSVTHSAEVTRSSRRMSDLIRFDFEKDNLLAFAFRINTRRLGLSRAPKGWFAVLFTSPKGSLAREVSRSIEKDLLDRMGPAARDAASRATGRKTHLQDDRFSRRPTEAIANEQRNVEESIRNMPGWWSVHTDHYILLSDLNSRKQSIAIRIQREIDILYEAFTKLLPPHGTLSDAGIIRMFNTPTGYRAYLPAKYAWTSGMWLPHTGELVICPTADNRSQDVKRILGTVYHEALHQYLHTAFDRVTAAPWFNEGHASLFENIRFNAHNEPRLIEDDYKLRILQSMAKEGTLDLKRAFALSYPDFYAHDPKQREQNYATAWGIVYYLRKAAPVEPHRKYADVADTYSAHLKMLHDETLATGKMLESVDVDELSEDFVSFWLSASRRHKAESNLILRRR